MIKQQTTQEKPVFGVGFKTKKKQVQKIEKPVVIPTTETPCSFQMMVEVPDGKTAWGRVMRSDPCRGKALANGWCEQHQHAQDGMDEGKRLRYRSVEIADAYTIIGLGKANWLAYFERATGSGLAKVMDYLSKQ